MSASSAIRRICILDPGFTQLPGHHHMWNSALEKAFMEQGYEPHFFFSGKLAPEILASYRNAVAHFRYDFYRRVPETPQPDTIAAYLTHALYMQRDLAPLTALVDNETLLFGHTFDAPAILGLALWYASLPQSVRPALFLNVHFSFAMPTSWTEASYRLAMQRLGASSRVEFSGTTDHIADFLTRVTGQKAPVLPMPFAIKSPRPPQTKGGRDLVYGFIGEDRLERNIAILPDAIAAYLEQGGAGRFFLQLTPVDPQAAPYIERLQALARQYPDRITLLLRGVYGTEYRELFGRFTVMLTPFSPKIYHEYRPSQVFQEAVAADMPCIACKGGFMGYEAEKLQNGSVLMEEPAAQSLTDALHTFEASAAIRFDAAKAAGIRYRERQGAQHIVRHVLQVLSATQCDGGHI